MLRSNLLIADIIQIDKSDIEQVSLSQKGYRNTSYPVLLKNGQIVNVIIYKTEPGMLERIKRVHQVTDYASRSNIPVRTKYSDKIAVLKTPHSTSYAAVYNYLPGDTIPWEAYTKKHIKLVGLALGRLHYSLKNFPALDHKITDEYNSIIRRMQRYFADGGVKQAMEEKLTLKQNDPTFFLKCEKLLEQCAQLPAQQMLHMDFVRGNLLFRPAEPEDTLVFDGLALSGIIDFEKTAAGSPLFDVARTVAFLLVDCKYVAPEKVKKYFLHSGYNKRSPAANIPPASPLLERLVTLFLFYDFYKFLRHNPYESLHANEHYVRTRDMLVSRGVLRYIKSRR